MRTLRFLCTLACALTVLALVTATGQAAPRLHARAHHAHTARVAAKPIARAAGSAGMVIAVDQETGQLRMPTPEELQALYSPADDPLNWSSDGLVAEPTPRGGVFVNVQNRFREFSVARVGADGKLVFGCGDSQAGAMSQTFTPNRPTGVLEVK